MVGICLWVISSLVLSKEFYFALQRLLGQNLLGLTASGVRYSAPALARQSFCPTRRTMLVKFNDFNNLIKEKL